MVEFLGLRRPNLRDLERGSGPAQGEQHVCLADERVRLRECLRTVRAASSDLQDAELGARARGLSRPGDVHRGRREERVRIIKCHLEQARRELLGLSIQAFEVSDQSEIRQAVNLINGVVVATSV